METQANEFPPYALMIERLFKKDMNNPAMNPLMHAALALHGECPELRDAPTVQNTVEECGDLEFYIEACKQHHTPDFQKAMEILAIEGGRWKAHNPRIAYDNLMSLGADLVDIVKKSWVYNKPLDHARVTFLLLMISLQLDAVYSYLGITREQVQRVNQNKLIGPEGRFRSGFYSDQAAQQRADKAEGVKDSAEGVVRMNTTGRDFFKGPPATA